MNFQGKKLILLSCTAFLLVLCTPYKQVNADSSQTNETSIVVPEKQKVQKKNNGEELTPKQKEELEINEDNVMNPFPG